MTSKQLIFLGLPGVDLETQAIALASRWQLAHVSGEAILSEGDSDSEEQIMKRLRRRLEQPDAMLQGFVLEGMPRSLAEAEAIDRLLAKFGQSEPQVVYFKAMTGLLIRKLLSQGNTAEPISAIRKRLNQQEEMLSQLLDYYGKRVISLSAALSSDEVLLALSEQYQQDTGAADWIRDETELNSLLQDEGLLVVDCIASWCGPCKLVTPMIDRLADTYSDRAQVKKIDFDANKQLPKRFGLKGMPAVMFFKGGELQETITGVKPYQAYTSTMSRFL